MRAKCAALLLILGLLSGCAKEGSIPNPPPGYTPPPKNPSDSSECNWKTVHAEVTNKTQPPSVYTLNCMVFQALDPKTPIPVKSELLAGNIDRSLLLEINKVREQYPYFKFSVKGPVQKDKQGKYSAEVDIDILNNLIALPAELDYDHGKWKLSKSVTCTLVGLIQQNPTQAKKDQLACFADNNGEGSS